MSAATPKELEAKMPECRLKVAAADVTPRKRELLGSILDWSLSLGREWAEFESYEDLGLIAWEIEASKQQVWRDLDELKKAGWVQLSVSRGEHWLRCRFLPNGELITPLLKEPPSPALLKAIFDARGRAAYLNKLPDGFFPDGQLRLPIETDEEHVDDALAAVSRESQPGETAAIQALMDSGMTAQEIARLREKSGQQDVDQSGAQAGEAEQSSQQNVDQPGTKPGVTSQQNVDEIESVNILLTKSVSITAGAGAPVPARADSLYSVIPDSDESGSDGSASQSGKRHRDAEVNLLISRIARLDPTDFQKGRGQWINRASGMPAAGDDCRRELLDAVSAVEHAQRTGKKFHHPLGKAFAWARKWAAEHGKSLRSFLCA